SFADLFEALQDLCRKGIEPQSYIGGTVPKRVVRLQPKSERMLVRFLNINAALFLYYDGLKEEVEARIENAVMILDRKGKKMPERYSREWWENRHTYFEMSPELAGEGLYVYVFDLCIPPSNVLQAAENVEQIAEKMGIMDILSHTLFGAVDAYTIALYVDDTPEGRDVIKNFEKELIPIVHSLGGSITRTHGLGTLFDDAIAAKEIGEHGLYLLKGIKNLLDPNRILNPGILHGRI
ncbi:MAG: hypothetical protein KAU14_06065, partial [Thermoplasmata archaeon]|nr:hypothetical protein [Thermoplasmata archaeon]